MSRDRPTDESTIRAALTWSGLSVAIRSRAVSALDRLLGALFGIPTAWLEAAESESAIALIANPSFRTRPRHVWQRRFWTMSRCLRASPTWPCSSRVLAHVAQGAFVRPCRQRPLAHIFRIIAEFGQSPHPVYSFGLRSHVPIVPHQGLYDAGSSAFIRTVSPQWVIFPAVYEHEHPRNVVAQRYFAAGVDASRLLRTDRHDGADPPRHLRRRP